MGNIAQTLGGSGSSAVAAPATGSPVRPPRAQSPDALVKELTDKLAWSVGSTLGTTYGRRSTTFEWANTLATRIVERHLEGN